MKKLISIAASLLMTMVVASSIFMPASAGPTPTGVTFAIESYENHTKDNVANSLEFKNIASDKLAEDVTFPVAVYAYNASGKDALSSVTLALKTNLPEGSFSIALDGPSNPADAESTSKSITQGGAFLKKDGKTYQGETNFGASIGVGKYTNGVTDKTAPEYKESVRGDGLALSFSVNDLTDCFFNDPTTDTFVTNPGTSKEDTIVYAAKDKWVAKFNVTLKSGLEKGAYNFAFDTDQDNAFLVVTSEQDGDKTGGSTKPQSIIDKTSFINLGLYVGVPAPTPKTMVIGIDDSAVNKAAKRELTAADKTKGYIEIVLPVFIKNDQGVGGIQGTFKVTGKSVKDISDFDKDSTSNADFTGLALASSNATERMYTFAIIVQKDVPDALKAPLPDGTVIVNLLVTVDVNATTESVEFNVEFDPTRNYEDTDPYSNLQVVGYDPNGDLRDLDENLTIDFKAAAVYVGPVIEEPQPTEPTPAPGTPAPGTPAPGTTVTTSSGGSSGIVGKPGDNGVTGIVSTLVILGLAGSALYFAKRKSEKQ